MNLLFSICMAGCLVAQASPEKSGETAEVESPQASDAEAIHDELRALRDELVKASKAKDVEGMARLIHPDGVITWQNGQRNRGPDGFRRFYAEMMEGEDRIVQSVTSEVTINDLSILYGEDTAVAFGEIDDHFHLTSGQKLDLHCPFTATLVKEDDRWLIASFHVSANLFDNPLLSAMHSLLYYVGGFAAIVGVVIGLIVGVRLGRRKAQAAPASS